jgi:ribonuclease P protein component
VLPRTVRLRSSVDFGETVRRGVRAGRPTLVVHARARRPLVGAATGEQAESAQVGFVVSRAVGNAVVRNRVKRRLRHLAAAELAATPPGTAVVVRALPAAATDGRLAADLHSAWSRAVDRLAEPREQGR